MKSACVGVLSITATKLRIYPTYSPRSSIHFLARYSNFCKPLKKKSELSSVQPGLRGSNDLRVGRKMATFQFFFFQSREQLVVRGGQIRRITCYANAFIEYWAVILPGFKSKISRQQTSRQCKIPNPVLQGKVPRKLNNTIFLLMPT